MKKSLLAPMLARRLGEPPGAVSDALSRCGIAGEQEADDDDMARAFLSVVTNARDGNDLARYAALSNATLGNLRDAMSALLTTGPGMWSAVSMNLAVFRSQTAPAVVFMAHTSSGPCQYIFAAGDPAATARTAVGNDDRRYVTGSAIAAIAVEFAGEDRATGDRIAAQANEFRSIYTDL